MAAFKEIVKKRGNKSDLIRDTLKIQFRRYMPKGERINVIIEMAGGRKESVFGVSKSEARKIAATAGF